MGFGFASFDIRPGIRERYEYGRHSREIMGSGLRLGG